MRLWEELEGWSWSFGDVVEVWAVAFDLFDFGFFSPSA